MITINGFPVVSEDSSADLIRPDGCGTGYIERDYKSIPLNSSPFTRASTIKRLSLQEIKELIAEKTANKTWLTDLADRVGSKVKNQQQSNYCWMHAPVRAMEYALLHAGGKAMTLSAFYAASRIKGGRNEGGWGLQAIEFLNDKGTCREDLWPPMKFRGEVTSEIQENAALHQIRIAEELEPDDYELIWSSIVQDQPVTVGIPAWGHEVLLNFLVLNGSSISEGFDNSWGTSYGKNGRGVLSGRMRRFSEAGRIAAMEASAS